MPARRLFGKLDFFTNAAHAAAWSWMGDSSLF
jgi:hypothetical protein